MAFTDEQISQAKALSEELVAERKSFLLHSKNGHHSLAYLKGTLSGIVAGVIKNPQPQLWDAVIGLHPSSADWVEKLASSGLMAQESSFEKELDVSWSQRV